MAASRIARYAVPVGATFLVQGSILADSFNRPNPAAVYAEPKGSCRPPPPETPEDCGCNSRPQAGSCEGTQLERIVMLAREELEPWKDTFTKNTKGVVDEATYWVERVQDNVCYLRTNAPQEVKLGTIAVGGLTGMLLGIRRGTIRKLFYGALGAGAGAYLAYPEETERYTKKYSCIAYNFIAGSAEKRK